jgi:hypothetical protein
VSAALAPYIEFMSNAIILTNQDIENAANFFSEQGWTEMEAEIWEAFENGDNGTMARAVAHYRAHQN